MVTTYPTIRKQVTEDAREISQLDDLRTSWVAAYRQKHAEADWWAEGFGAVEHSPETQERVFRMAEQLAGRGIDRFAVFAALRHADAVPQASSGSLHEGVALQTQHLYVQGRAIRSDEPAEKLEQLFYYEVLLKNVGEAMVRRYQGSHQPASKREQVGFALTHEAVGKLVGDLTSES